MTTTSIQIAATAVRPGDTIVKASDFRGRTVVTRFNVRSVQPISLHGLDWVRYAGSMTTNVGPGLEDSTTLRRIDETVTVERA